MGWCVEWNVIEFSLALSTKWIVLALTMKCQRNLLKISLKPCNCSIVGDNSSRSSSTFENIMKEAFHISKMSIPEISQRDTLDSIYPEIVQSLIVESRRHKMVGEILNNFWGIQPKQRRPNYKSDEHFRKIHFIHPKSTITWSQWRVQSNTAGFRMRSIKRAYSRLLNLNRRNYRTKAHRSFS